MTNLQKLIALLSDSNYYADFVVAKNSNTCVICKKQAKKFSTNLTEFEFINSAICERCQETYINNALEQFETS